MTDWNQSWKASTQPRKQRAYVRNAPKHAQGTLLAGHLSKELRAKHKTRSVRIRVGDKVKVMRGAFRNKAGKVERINVKDRKIYITGIELIKRDGSKAMYPVHPSNILIQELDLSDKRRLGEVKKQ